MPLISIDIIGDIPGRPAHVVADACAKILGSPVGETWVRLRAVPVEHYAENGTEETKFRPVFAHIVRYKLPDRETLATEAQQLAQAIASPLQRPVENVHVIFEPDGAGRVAFGGQLVE